MTNAYPHRSPEHELFRDHVRHFIDQEIQPHYDTWEREGIVPRELWRAAGTRGLLNCALPEPFGEGGDFGHAAVVIEELARANCLGIGFSIHSDMVAPYLYKYDTPYQRRRWLPGMRAGKLIGAIAMTEPGAGSDLKAIATRARRDGNQYVLTGQKTFVTNGVNADLVLVVASTAPELGARGLSLFCVEAGTPGFTKGRPLAKVGQHAQDTCELFFDEVRVPASHLLGEENRAFEYVAAELVQERLAIALRAAASLEGMIGQTAAYVRERRAFGRSVADYQNTRFKLADARSQAAMLRTFLDVCMARHLRDGLDPVTAAMAKLNATELQGRILDDLLQLHGGYGYMSEYGIGRAWADARALRILGGTSEILREIIARAR